MSQGGKPGGNGYASYTNDAYEDVDGWDTDAGAAPAGSAALFQAGASDADTAWDLPLETPPASSAPGRPPAGAWDVDPAEGEVPAVGASGEVRIDAAAPGPTTLRAATEAALQEPSRRGADAPGEGKTAFYQLAHYRGYFDVDTTDVLQRMLASIIFRRDFFAQVEAAPDLYGPFWLSTAAIFLMAMVANAVSWEVNRASAGAWSYDVEKVVYAAALFYGYVFVGGAALWAWLFLLNSAQVSLTALWCIYGYSMTIWIPVSIVSIVPNDLFHWLLAMGASLYSGVFLVVNLKQAIAESLATKTKQFFTIIAVFAAHLATGVLLRVFVFTYAVGDTGAQAALEDAATASGM